MEWIVRAGIVLGAFPALEALAPGLSVVVTTRSGGTSEAPFDSLNLGGKLGDRPANIARNRRRLLAALDIAPRMVARTGQVHGAEIAVVTRGGQYPGYDGFLTRRRGLTLAISTADCFSVVIYSPPERTLAAIHVGRRGAERGIVRRAIDVLGETAGVDPAYAVAAVGPGICGSCYTVSRDDAMKFPRGTRRFARGVWRVDLGAFIARELERGGVPPRHVIAAGLCTACRPDLFYSHRRDGGVTGRHWTLATMLPAAPEGPRCR